MVDDKELEDFLEEAGNLADHEVEDGDEVDNAIHETINHLTEASYPDEEAESLVYQAISNLIEKNVIPDSPDISASCDVKLAWIQTMNSHVWTELRGLGVDVE